MSMTSIKLIPVTHYRVEIEGVNVGTFREVDKWHGMSRMVSDIGMEEIIVSSQTNAFDIFDAMLGTKDKPVDATLIRASKKFCDSVKAMLAVATPAKDVQP